MAIYKKQNSGYLPFVQKTEVNSPFTNIQNRAKLDDSLKTSFGVERLHVNSLELNSKEFGPNGEPVYGPDSGDDRIRFVGNWTSIFNTDGQGNQSFGSGASFDETSGYFEITFYGTSLVLLANGYRNVVNVEITIDGVSSSSNIGGFSGVTEGRNYKTFTNKIIAESLPLGWHTVKIQGASGSTGGLMVQGFEIINESADMTVKSGKAHGNGNEYIVENDLTVSYNTGFDNVADIDVSSKGGRVAVYVDPMDGTVKKALTKVDTAPAYLALTDHTNEAPYRVINFREFGRNRGDDFSTLAGQRDSAFTLDDGTTTLIGSVVDANGFEFLRTGGSGFWILTFVGTGLSILRQDTANGGADDFSVFIDGVDVGQLNTTGSTLKRVEHICSGLPYGTHTVKIEQTSAVTFNAGVIDFIVYQPKKPTLPEGAIELADYNLLGSYSFNTSINTASMSQGVITKSPLREVLYNGSFSLPGPDAFDIRRYAFSADTSTSGARVSYTFFGTGFEMHFITAINHTASSHIEIDGVTVTPANFPTANIEYKGSVGTGYNTTTGNIDQNNDGNPRGDGALSVTNLPLGVYTVELVNDAANTMSFNSVDIITPIHSPHTTFGSLSMKDVRNFDSAKDVNNEVREKISFASVNDSPTEIFKSKGISQVLNTGTGFYNIYLENPTVGVQTVIGSCTRGGKIFATVENQKQNDKVRVQIESNAGVENSPFDISIKGKEQKDEFKD